MTIDAINPKYRNRVRRIPLEKVYNEIDHTYKTMKEINKNLNMNIRTLRSALKRLVDSGRIKKTWSLQDIRIVLYRRRNENE